MEELQEKRQEAGEWEKKRNMQPDEGLVREDGTENRMRRKEGKASTGKDRQGKARLQDMFLLYSF